MPMGWVAAAALVISLGGWVIRAVARQNVINDRDGWKSTAEAQELTINALEPRIDSLEKEVKGLKERAVRDHTIIAALKAERTRLRSRVTVLSKKVAVLTSALLTAGIAMPDLPDEEDYDVQTDTKGQ